MIVKPFAFAAVVLAAAGLAAGSARAETYHTCAGFIDSLPAVISTQGTWCLRADLSTAVTTGAAILIETNNVTIDCNGFKLGGLPAGVGTTTRGIYAEDRSNTTVRHCTIRGFAYGVQLLGAGGGGHIVEHNRFDSNRLAGIEVHGDGSTVRHNLVYDSGGTTAQAQVFGIAVVYAVDVRDNVVDGVMANASFANGSPFGIYLVSNDRGAIVGNRVAGLVSTGTGVARGVHSQTSGAITIADNIAIGDNRAGGIGLRCATTEGIAKDNVVIRFATQVSNCVDVGTTP